MTTLVYSKVMPHIEAGSPAFVLTIGEDSYYNDQREIERDFIELRDYGYEVKLDYVDKLYFVRYYAVIKFVPVDELLQQRQHAGCFWHPSTKVK